MFEMVYVEVVQDVGRVGEDGQRHEVAEACCNRSGHVVWIDIEFSRNWNVYSVLDFEG